MSTKSTPILTLELSDRGVERVVARPKNIRQANDAALLQARLAAPIELLHQIAGEEKAHVAQKQKQNENENRKHKSIQQIWVCRDEINGIFEQLPLHVAAPIRSLDQNVPSWLLEALHRLSPNHFAWKNAPDLKGGIVEAAVTVLDELGRDFLDHAGWTTDQRGHVLVSEPYQLTLNQILSLTSFVSAAGLQLRISGASNHAPSSTLRIEIFETKTQTQSTNKEALIDFASAEARDLFCSYVAPKPVELFALKVAKSLCEHRYNVKQITTRIGKEALDLVNWLRRNEGIDEQPSLEAIQRHIIAESKDLSEERVRGRMRQNYLITIAVALKEVGTKEDLATAAA